MIASTIFDADTKRMNFLLVSDSSETPVTSNLVTCLIVSNRGTRGFIKTFLRVKERSKKQTTFDQPIRLQA